MLKAEYTEAELLHALSRSGPVQVDLYRRQVFVSTHYRPQVRGVGATLMDATKDCIFWLFDVLRDRPEDEAITTRTVAALKKLGISP